MQKDTHDHGENVPLMREETSDGKVTTAGYYKVRCRLPSSHGSTMCLNLRVTFRPWVLIRPGNSLFQVLGQCGWAKKGSEQWNSERAKREGKIPVSIFSNSSIHTLLSNFQMSKRAWEYAIKGFTCSTCLLDSALAKPNDCGWCLSKLIQLTNHRVC